MQAGVPQKKSTEAMEEIDLLHRFFALFCGSALCHFALCAHPHRWQE